MRTGQLLYRHTDLSIGGEHGLELIRHFSPITPGTFTPGTMGGFSHSWDIRINERRVKGPLTTGPTENDYVVSMAGSRTITFRTPFDPSPGDFAHSSEGLFSWLDFEYVVHPSDGTIRPTRYIYKNNDYEQIDFRTTGSSVSSTADQCGGKCAFASQVKKADGTVYTLSYNAYSGTTAPRLRSVVSNRGFALLFEYRAPGTHAAGQVTKACALNLAYTALPAITAEAICPSGVPTATYSYNASGKLISFVDQGGIATSIGPDGSALYWPGEGTPYATNTTVQSTYQKYVTAQSFADGRSYSYSWNTDGNLVSMIAGGSYTDNNGRTVTVQYGKYRRGSYDPTWYVTNGPELVTDEIGRSWNYFYGCSGTGHCSPSYLKRVTAPEQDKVQFTYDGIGNTTETRQISKTGGGLADLVSTSTFATGGNTPLSITDARGNVTDFTYDPVHGGVLTATGPADVAGVRPQTRYTYALRYAWVKSGSSYSQASSPVWVLTSEEYCRISAASGGNCGAGASDEVVTTYDYGPNSGPNNLWLRGVAVTADGQTLRTCYGYDSQGRRIYETQPNANLVSCS